MKTAALLVALLFSSLAVAQDKPAAAPATPAAAPSGPTATPLPATPPPAPAAAAPAATGFLQQLKAVGMTGQRGLAVVDQLISREAATLAVNDVFWLCSVIFILMIPLLWLAKPPFGSAGGPGGH